MVYIVLALEIISLVSSYLQYDLLQTVANGGYLSESEAEANDSREQIIGIIYLVAYVISCITFIMWFRRAYYNLHQRISTLSYSEGWAAGCWFVPIVNLYLPYQIMKELYVETKELLSQKGLAEKVGYTTAYLEWWWILWIIDGVLEYVVFRFSPKIDELDLDGWLFITGISIVSGITGIILALITIKVIKDYSNVEPVLFEIEENEIQTEE
ncbi:MAG: DUF4328 domain-containing protein [Tannerella sp.]|nr:DUF4328 domain-containing protein [Tannerella sp.]